MFRRFEADLSVDFREFLSCRLRLSSLNVRNLFSCFPTAHFLPLTTTSPARSSKFSTMFFPCINKCIIITISSPLIKLKFMKLNAQHRSIQNKWEKICFNNNNSSVFFWLLPCSFWFFCEQLSSTLCHIVIIVVTWNITLCFSHSRHMFESDEMIVVCLAFWESQPSLKKSRFYFYPKGHSTKQALRTRNLIWSLTCQALLIGRQSTRIWEGYEIPFFNEWFYPFKCLSPSHHL